MMVRTQISLDPEQHRRAKRRAAELGISLSEYIRQTLATDLQEQPKGDISAIFGIFSSAEPTDIARDKDEMVGDAVWQEYLRETGRAPRR